MPRILVAVYFLLSSLAFAEGEADNQQNATQATINELEQPLYNPFVERYVLDELKQLRVDLSNLRSDMSFKIAEKEVGAADRAVTYATDTVTYFFYLIAGVSSILVLVGYSSIREIKERVHSIADEKLNGVVEQYEARLRTIEKQLKKETRQIEENREEIERTQELQSLWLRAGQETEPQGKLDIYDRILAIKPDDCEALTYKADAVLELDEPQWAANLCQQALAIDSDNAHAFYQLACAQALRGSYEEALVHLGNALKRNENYRTMIMEDPALAPIRKLEDFKQFLAT